MSTSLWPAREKPVYWWTIWSSQRETAYGNLNDPSQPLDLSWVSNIYGYSPNAQPGRNAMAHMIHQQWGAPNYHHLPFTVTSWSRPASGNKDPHQAKDINQENYIFLATTASKYIQYRPLVAWIPELLTVSFGKIAYPPSSSDWRLLPHAQQWWPVGCLHLEVVVLELWMACGSPLKFPTWLVWNWQACSQLLQCNY